jgi:putative ABC transport system permease protein
VTARRLEPPPLSRRCIEWAARRLATPELADDAEELFAQRVERDGQRRARQWYRRQARASFRRALLTRRQGRQSGRVAGRRGGGVSISWLDVKLGLRMLVKYPGLTGAAMFALAIAIPAGLSPSHFMNAVLRPLPGDEGGRIQVLRNIDTEMARAELTSSQDYRWWSEELTAFETLGAAATGISYNVISEDGRAAPVPAAEVTASTFDVLRVRPLLGRTLLPEDEVVGAPAVVVIGHDLWQSRLDGAPDVIGRAIRIGRVPHVVVGVMPEGFLFLFRDQLWLPRRTDVLGEASGDEARHLVFGRLADGVSPDEAQAELSAFGQRMALEFPSTHTMRLPEVVPFSIGYFGMPKGGMQGRPEWYVIQVLAMLVLVVACANVGMLLFTRTVTRAEELAVRSALGASRARVVSQLFAEALVFAVLAAGMGLLFGDWLSGQFDFLLPLAPYWTDLGVTRATVFWALLLAVFSAAVVGVIPALKVTGKSVQRSIQHARAGRSGVRFGGISSALIIVDVALAVATVGLAVGLWSGVAKPTDGIGRLSEQFLSAELSLPEVNPGSSGGSAERGDLASRLGATQQELVRRLVMEPGVRSVAVGSSLPGGDIRRRSIELDSDMSSDDFEGHEVRPAYLAPEFFAALEQPVLSGRGFMSADVRADNSAVVVNTAFVDRVLRGRNPIGRRLRYTTLTDEDPGPWYDIVGVVGDLGMDDAMSPGIDPGVYHPLVPGEVNPVRIAIRLGEDPAAFAPRLRSLTSDVDPTALISNLMPLDELSSPDANMLPWMIRGLIMLTCILLALSVSGIYALMSFTVSERTKEIGIRTALGARQGSVVRTVARRAIAQLAIGVVLGMVSAVWILSEFRAAGRIPTNSPVLLTLMIGAGVMGLIGVIACAAPTLRALRVMPTEALRGGG